MNLEQKVVDQISEWTDGQIMFTAYDITLALRSSGERVNHDDVKKIVHRMYSNQDMNTAYQRSNIQVPGTTSNAFLYHHLNSDIDEYEPLKSPSKTPTISSSTVQRQGVRNKQPVNGILPCAYPKHNGSLTIPSVLLKQSGLKGQTLSIIKDGDKIILTSTDYASDNYGSQIIEDKKPKSDNVVILPRRILKSLSKNTYTIELSSNNKEIHVG